MKLVALIDAVALEQELLTRLEQAHDRDGAAARTLVLLPTRRLASHVQRRLLERRPGWLGLETLTFGGLARRVLASTDAAPLKSASPLLLESLLASALRAQRENFWSRHALRRPGTVGRLSDSLRDLREAAISPEELEPLIDGSEPERDLSAIYKTYCLALEQLAERGQSDEAGLARAARPHLANHVSCFDRIFVYGAYEFLGIYQDLLQTMSCDDKLTIFLPIQPRTRVSGYAEHHARTFLELDPDRSETALIEVDTARAKRLAMLHDEQAGERIEGSPRLRCRHSQGAAAEIGTAVRQALASVREGVDPSEIAIVARSLEPYAAAFEQCLDDAGLSWSSSLASPLRRQPVARDFLLLLATVRDDFPREATVRLLHAQRIDWSGLEDSDACPTAASVDRWSLEAGLLSGLTEWQTLLPESVGASRGRRSADQRQRAADDAAALERRSAAEALAARLGQLAAAIPQESARWSEHAARFSSLLKSLFPDSEEPTRGRLLELIKSMAAQETLLDDRRPTSLADAIGWLERAVAGSTIQLREEDRGIRVLDLMQARGLTFRRIHWVGMNSGLFPRRARRDPILTDSLRERLVRAHRRPLGISPPDSSEEHLLLGLIVGSASEQVDFSWQRADEAGRAKVPSLALREVARIATGRPDMQAWIEDAQHIPSHPEETLKSWLDITGLLHPAEGRLLAALRSRAADVSTTLIERFPELGPGMRMLAATQSFEPIQGSFDGRLGAASRSLTLSVSQAEMLGSCPLRYFFSRVLGVRSLQERASLFQLAANELGTQVHQLLQRIYQQLEQERLFERGEAGALVARAIELLEEAQEGLFGDLQFRLAARLPQLWRSQQLRWMETLRRFLGEDLQRIGDAGLRPLQFEQLISREVDFGEGIQATLRGMFDRVFIDEDGGSIIGDYKTSKSLARRIDRSAMLKGSALQVPLYQRMLDNRPQVELMALHPEVGVEDEDRRVTFEGFDEAQEAAFVDTMRVLLRLPLQGIFPFRSDKHCEWCEFQLSCRRLHPPTQERESHAADSEPFRQLTRRSTRKPHGR